MGSNPATPTEYDQVSRLLMEWAADLFLFSVWVVDCPPTGYDAVSIGGAVAEAGGHGEPAVSAGRAAVMRGRA